MYNCTTCSILILLFSIFVFTSTAFNLYIESDEMNRTLGISARMDYVIGGVINEYSTKFPYRLAENISRLRFTWSSSERMTYYSLQAISQHFDVVPIILIPSNGYVPNIPQQFQVEYRCVGARSGQFRVHLHFNITTKTSLQLTLKQEKICSYREGRRRAFAQEEDQNNHYNINNNNNENNNNNNKKQNNQQKQQTLSTLPLFSFLSLLSLPCQLLVASVSLFALVCSILLCCCYCIKQEEEEKEQQQQQTNNNFVDFRRRRSKIGSLYNSTRSSIIRRKILFQQGIEQKNKLNGSLKESSATKSGLSQITTTGLATVNSCSTTAPSSSKTNDEQRKPLLDPLNDPQMPSTSAAALQINKKLNKIIYENTNQVDVNQALVELNADRNLFEQCHRPEMEGDFGQLVWASWRQIGQNGNRPVVDEVDDGEDDAKEDTALICKTLKPDADRIQFERFLRSALQFHYVPSHPHLAQVIAAATFGNFLNPDSVRDLPLICYSHDGFGILKNFLRECREQAINASLLNNKKSSSVSPGVVVKSWAKRFRKGSSCSDGLKEEEKKIKEDEEIKLKEDKAMEKGIDGLQMENPRIVVTNTPSSSSSNAPATASETSETTSTLRIHNLVLLASQIVSAVRHLHKFGIIHKDIATRNCLVSHIRMTGGRVRLHSQLCDSSLGSDLFPEDYKKEENLLENEYYSNYLPIRWMSPELFNSSKKLNNQQNNQNNNSASDIWACGILIWEIFNCGKLPYSEIHEDEMEQAIVYAGLRLSQPYNCPDELYSIMSSCWTTTPEDRPTASELDLNLQEFMQRLSKYI